MPQTIMAVLALLIVTLMSVTQQREMVEAAISMLDDEVEVMATGVAMQAMEQIRLRAFDTQTKVTYVTNVSNLTLTFPTGKKCDLTPPIQTGSPYSDCAALEDFNQMQGEMVPVVYGADTLRFTVTASVTYLDSQRQPTTTRSFWKEVTLSVQDYQPAGRAPKLRTPVTLSRIFSYP